MRLSLPMALRDVGRHTQLRRSRTSFRRARILVISKLDTDNTSGTAQQPGIIFLTMQELFEKIEERKDEKVIEVSLSYLEIYNETIRDLLVPGGSKAGLMLREDANQAVSVAGLSSHHPKNVSICCNATSSLHLIAFI
jgi:Kinesin motor domain